MSSGNVFSTNSAQFVRPQQAIGIQRAPRWSINQLVRFWALATVGIVAGTVVTHRGRRILRVVLYARYSTDEQDESSIPDQFAYCRRHLTSIGFRLDKLEIIEISDAEISGEVVSRPGIDRVDAGIERHEWDLIICEDSSRLFRNVGACTGMVGEAFDLGISTIAINDDVDTNEEGWEDRLEEAAAHHARTNRYTSKRIKRKLSSLWRSGAAIGKLRPGYRRIRPEDEMEQVGRRRPKFDEINPETAPIVLQTYERIATGEPAESVAQWLTEVGFSKAGRNSSTTWTAKDVILLIRRTIYRGFDVYRANISEKRRNTGKRYTVANQPESVLTRDMSHLRIVSDALWHQANAAIDARRTRENVARGEDSPLFGKARSSSTPLANVLYCVCENKLWAAGRRGNCYKCRGACRNECWRHATIPFDVAHSKLSIAIADELFNITNGAHVLSEHIRSRLASDEERDCVAIVLPHVNARGRSNGWMSRSSNPMRTSLRCSSGALRGSRS